MLSPARHGDMIYMTSISGWFIQVPRRFDLLASGLRLAAQTRLTCDWAAILVPFWCRRPEYTIKTFLRWMESFNLGCDKGIDSDATSEKRGWRLFSRRRCRRIWWKRRVAPLNRDPQKSALFRMRLAGQVSAKAEERLRSGIRPSRTKNSNDMIRGIKEY